MNENINLCELLKGHEGETFYSPLYGDVTLDNIKYTEDYPIRVITNKGEFNTFMNDGKYHRYYDSECMLFPSKDQRDWNKWVEEQKPKVPKTWNELVESNKAKTIVLYVADNHNHLTPIEKAALALLRIHQIIEIGYGGNITNEEWEDETLEKYAVDWVHGIITNIHYAIRHHISFHTEEQMKEFLSYPENVQLIKDYYMA